MALNKNIYNFTLNTGPPTWLKVKYVGRNTINNPKMTKFSSMPMGPTLQMRLAERRGADNTGGQRSQGGRPPPVSETRGGDNRQQQQEAGGSGQGHDHLDVVDGEHARAAIHAALEPVVVDAAHERDEVPLVEAQLALVLGVEVVQCPAARGAGAPGWRPHRRWKRRR